MSRDLTMKFKMSKSIERKLLDVTHHMKRSPELKSFILQSAYIPHTVAARLFCQKS